MEKLYKDQFIKLIKESNQRFLETYKKGFRLDAWTILNSFCKVCDYNDIQRNKFIKECGL